MKATKPRRIALYHQHLRGGGATQVVLHVMNGLLAAGYAVDLVVNDDAGHYAQYVPNDVQIVPLARSSQERARLYMLRAALDDIELLGRPVFVSRKKLDKLLYLPALTRYLNRRRPALLISNLWQLGVTSITARAVGSPATRIACVFHSSYFYQCGLSQARAQRPRKLRRWRRFLDYCRIVYARADALIAVSNGIAEDLVRPLGLAATAVQTIYNPIVKAGGIQRPMPPDHAWFHDRGAPVIVAIGRLSPEKNFDDLLHAFAKVRARKPARLVILGEGDDRGDLEALVTQLDLEDAIDLPGWVDDPAIFLCHADLFVLSSQWEGLPTVLIETLACGCPTIAYDCAHGPREILDNGHYGDLVPVGDVPALTDAIIDTLSTPQDRERLRRRAMDFSITRGVSQYLHLTTELAASADTPDQDEIDYGTDQETG